ncbi:peptidase M6 [Streptomyces sp. HNM0574]|uniref:peptidase M6 n=1 Tax=Streptomyces sp. HNM0574 TaxID=2714954 RepID=UPI00146B98CF|nr:peptidase M6 [Streptomyces sp. HNM0574]NLU67617.1 peptidase M6 [Streptomyces sp. HNM0574]
MAAAPHRRTHRIRSRAYRTRGRGASALASTTALATATLIVVPVNTAAAAAHTPPMSGPCAVDPGPGFDEGPPASDLVHPVGHKKAAMIMVDFPDLPASAEAADRSSFFADYGRAHLDRASYGKYQLDLEATPKWIRMPRPWSSYGISRGNPPETTRAYVQDALDAAREQAGTDFAGTDVVYVVADENVPASPSVSQANVFTGLRTGDQTIHGAALVFGRHQDSALWQRGNFVHEGHHLYGLPDLYNVSRGATVEWAGGWDTMSMAGISDLLGWHKWKLGWLGRDQVNCLDSTGTETHRLDPVGGKDGARITVARTGPSRAVVAEARTRTGLDGEICSEGVLLYTVDSRVATGEGPVRVADSRPHSKGGAACGGREPAALAELGDAPFRPGESHTLPGGVTVRVIGGTPDGGYSIRVTKR